MPKRMIAYANGNYTYSAIMRESIKQAGTPENALYRFREMVSEQLNQAATDKKIVEINQTIPKNLKKRSVIYISFAFPLFLNGYQSHQKTAVESQNIVAVVENRKNIVRR